MRFIDRYAYSNRLCSVDPMQKAALALTVIALCLILDRPAVGLLAAGWMWGLAAYRAGVSGRAFGRLLLAEGLFLLLGVVGIALSVGPAVPARAGWNWSLGPVGLSSNEASVETAARVATRALGSAAAMNLLALTTPLMDLLDLLRRGRVPVLLIDLMALTYRFTFCLLESLTRMYTAQESRLGYVNVRRGMVSAGMLGGQLLVDACQRSRRLETALVSRGYSGDLRVLPAGYRQDRWLPWLALGIVLSLLLAGVLS